MRDLGFSRKEKPEGLRVGKQEKHSVFASSIPKVGIETQQQSEAAARARRQASVPVRHRERPCRTMAGSPDPAPAGPATPESSSVFARGSTGQSPPLMHCLMEEQKQEAGEGGQGLLALDNF
jgi:hypothetical protein